MTLKDLLKKKDRIRDEGATNDATASIAKPADVDVPEFTFMRTTTTTQEFIKPPSFPGDPKAASIFRRSTNSPLSPSPEGEQPLKSPRSEKRISELLHLGGRSRSNSNSNSVKLPTDLPTIDAGVARSAEQEAQWEKRATLLARGTTIRRHGTATSTAQGVDGSRSRSRSPSPGVNDVGGDTNIQEAIRLHEAGELEQSTKMFGKLADPNGANNALSQVLYGLALRHGWGCEPDTERAITYLTHAATNSAEVESLALSAGMQKGGAAKGELVLAIYELANCFRNGWGVKKDAAAARQYYEVAANLGDPDGCNEAAWCYLEGFGGKKDKFKAAQFYRLAEEKGNKTIGNSWIWKEKYTPKP
ncbi:HCP-like protein [Saccharata proteae CBS 121410]|uniref:HCP-like protein n=1 Tax=Saccharata proteae CBS 121410 TaxID=1314787 RepID=A0A9P4HZH8_9PEZI|nr:HCP-like protein [Saccharata proteae CBS 121410]